MVVFHFVADGFKGGNRFFVMLLLYNGPLKMYGSSRCTYPTVMRAADWSDYSMWKYIGLTRDKWTRLGPRLSQENLKSCFVVVAITKILSMM